MKLKFLAPSLVVLGGLLITTTVTYSKPADAKKTSKQCAFCHVDVKKGPKNLTDAGKYYKEHNSSLEGYKPAN